MIKEYIKRPLYLEKVIPFIDQDLIKVLIGQRRVGKSYLLYQIMDVIRERRKDAHIIFIDKERHEFDEIGDHRALVCAVESESKGAKGRIAVFIDEIQEIHDFEKALRSLAASGRYDLYCTGSNATLLSGELATRLSGRYVAIDVHSLTYPEFLTFHRLTESEESFFAYLKYGGLPYLIHVELTDAVVYDYLVNVNNTILFKDVVARFNIRNVHFLERLVDFIADNIGSIVSAKRISDFLKSQHINISPNVVLDYLSHLCSAFFIGKVPRIAVKGKKVFEINEKYYFEDLGLRHAVRRYAQADIGKVLENAVYHHLRANGYDVKVGQLGSKEIDFVCEKDGERLYIQVAATITDDNREREFGNLLAVFDNYRKVVLSLGPLIDGASYKGIEHMNVRTFLMG